MNIGADRPNHPWLPSINKCFKKGLLPASYQDLRQTRRNISPSWSGVISSDVIYTYTGICESVLIEYYINILFQNHFYSCRLYEIINDLVCFLKMILKQIYIAVASRTKYDKVI